MTNKHYELIQQYYSEVSQETKDMYQGKTGIYAVYCDETLVYIGKSTDLLNRFIAHKANTFCDESPEYNSKKYQQLRKAVNLGHNITLKVLEFCGDCSKEELSRAEDKWIGKYLPPLNAMIPAANGRHTRKPVADIC